MARSRDDNKRKAVMLSAAALFSTKGYAATSIQDIVVHSGFSVGTVYNYFENKEELLKSLIEEGWDEFFQSIQSSLTLEDKVQPLKSFYEKLFDTVVENIDVASLLINEPLLYPKLEKIANELFNFLMVNSKILPQGINKSIFYASVIGTIQSIKLAKKGFIDIDITKLKEDIEKKIFNISV